MELVLFLVADYANVAQGDKLNVMGIFNLVNAPKFPTRHPEMYLVAKFSVSPAEYSTTRKITMKLLNDDATQELFNWSRDVIVPKAPGGRRAEVNQILQVRDIVFPQPGIYQFSVLVDQDEKGSLPLYVMQLTPTGS